MHPFPPIPITFTDEERLGALAMQFRGTRCDTERQDIARKYARTVNRLIQDGNWYEIRNCKETLRRELTRSCGSKEGVGP
jgi:hypothetical protein